MVTQYSDDDSDDAKSSKTNSLFEYKEMTSPDFRYVEPEEKEQSLYGFYLITKGKCKVLNSLMPERLDKDGKTKIPAEKDRYSF